MSTPTFDPDAPAEGDGLFGLPHTPEDAAIVVIPVGFEATASYRRGTKGAPAAIVEASAQVDLHDVETGDPWEAGIALEPEDPRIAGWDEAASADALEVIANGGRDPGDAARCARVEAIQDQLNALVHARAGHWISRGRIPAVLGGDHSTPYGAIRAANERWPGLGVLHIDAHADLRVAFEGFRWSHASVMYNVSKLPNIGNIVQVGIRDLGRAERTYAEDNDQIHSWFHPHVAYDLLGGEPWRRIAHRMIDALPENVWVSFDIDGLDPAFCPGTGTPVPGGLSFDQALVLLRVLGESGKKIVGFDLNEVGTSEWDAIVGARVLYKLAGWALVSQGRIGG